MKKKRMREYEKHKYVKKVKRQTSLNCNSPVNGNEAGNFISPVPLMRLGRDHT